MTCRIGIATLAVGLLAACQPSAPPQDKAAAPSNPLEEAPAPRRSVAATAAPFVNEEYGIHAVFPVGNRVCESLSGEHPQGFYTRLGDSRMVCGASRDLPRTSAIVIVANYNAAFYDTMEDVTGSDCPSLNPAEADGRRLGFPGLDSTVCEKRAPDGEIEIGVYAFAGSWEGEAGRAVPYVVYSAYLISGAASEAADRATFQRFLDQVRLTPPDPAT